MKFKKVMLVTIMLLAIITIGAVSAADELTDAPASDQLEISGDDAIISNDDSQIPVNETNGFEDDNLGDDYDPDGDYDPDYDDEPNEIDPAKIDIPEVYVIGTFDDEGLRINLPWDFEGHVTFKLDNKTLYDYDVDDEVYINLNKEDYGTYKWQLNCTGYDYKPFYMTGNIELTYMDIKVPEQIIIGSYSNSYISVTFSTSVSGTVTVYIDGERYTSKRTSDDDENTNLRFYLDDLSIGNHSYNVTYTGNKDPITVNGTLNVDYVFATEGEENTGIYGESYTLTVILPWDASGKLTAKVNGKSFEADVKSLDDDYDEVNYIKMEIDNLNLGENPVTVTYSGNDKYPSKTINTAINAVAEIQYERNMVYTNPYIYLTLPSDAKGNFIVRINDEDFANITGENGLFNVSLKSLKLDLYEVEAYYDGEDYDVDSVYNYFSIIPNITAPQIVNYYEGALISIEVPSDVNGTFTIYKGWDDYDRILINSTEIENGKASILLKSFDYIIEDNYAHNHFIMESVTGSFTYSTYYQPSLRYYPRDSDFEVSVEKNILRNTEYLVCQAMDNVSRSYKIYIDGKFVCEKWNGKYSDEDYTERMEIPVKNLTYGQHEIEFRYVDNEGYYDSINKTYHFNVTYLMIEIPDEIINFDEITLTFDEEVTGNVTVYIDGKEYDRAIINGSYSDSAYFYIESLSYATHEVEVIYFGDETHGKVTEKANVDFTYSIGLYDNDDVLYAIYGQNKDVTVVLPWDVTGDVSITVNGKKYTAKAHDYTDMTIGNFAYGKDEIAITYEGDSKYPAKTVKYRVSTSAEIFVENNVVSLTLPSDAKGNLTVKIDDEVYQTVALLNGKASIDLNALKDINYIEASYTGEDYYVESVWANYRYNITAPKYVWIEEGALITAKLPSDYKGEIIVYQYHGEDYDEYVEKTEVNRTTLVNGYGTVRITSFDGVARDDYDDSYYNTYSIEYVNGGLVKYRERYTPIVMADSPNKQLELKLDKEALKEWYMDVTTNINLDGYGSRNSGYLNVYIDGDYYRRYYDNEFSLDCNNLTYGTHTIKVDYSGSEYYSPSTATASFNVTYLTVDVSDEVVIGEYQDASFGSDLRIYSNSDARGYVIVYIDGDDVWADFAGYGGIVVDLSNCTAGTHTYKVVYSGDDKYAAITKTGTFKGIYSGMLIVDSYIYVGDDEDIKVIVPKDATGKIELTVNGTKYTETLINGTAKFSIKGLTEGDYEVTAKYLGDEKYDAYYVGTDEIRVQDDDEYYIIMENENTISYGDSIIISLELPEIAKGELIVYLDEELYNSSVLVNGKAKIVISNLNYGDYDVSAEYYSDDWDFDVNSLYEVVHVSPEIYDYNSTYTIGDEIIIPIEFESDANGDLLIYEEGKLLGSQKVVNGKINLNLTDIAHFGYNFLKIHYDDGKYNFTDSIYIKIHPKMTYTNKISIGEVCEVSFVFPEDFNGELVIYVETSEDKYFSITTNVVSGKAGVSITNLTAGTNWLSYTYRDGNYTFTPYEYYYDYGDAYYRVYVEKLDADLKVTNSATATKVEFDIDVTGAVIAKINGNYYYCVIEDGEAEFDAAGSEILLSYTGDGKYKLFKYKAVNSTGPIVELPDPGLSVSAADIDVGSNATINVKANSGLTADVNVNMDGKDYTVNVKNGKGSLTVSDLAVKTYTVTVTFAGNDAFKKSKNTTTFTVKKLTPEIAIKADESIVEQSDLAVEVTVAGATGIVKINDETIILENGKASTNISNLTIGENTITVTYSGDDKYLNATQIIKVNVYPKADPKIKVTVADISAGKTATVNIEINGTATGNVIVTFNSTDTPATITDGKASIELTGLPEGTYTVTAKYDGNKYLTPGKANATFKVAKFESTVSVSNIEFAYGDSGSASMTITGASGVDAYVVDHPEAIITVESNKITVSNLPIGEYVLKVTTIPLTDYAAASTTANVSVIKMATAVSSSKVTTTYGTSKNIVVTLKDANGNPIEGKTVKVVLNKKTYSADTNAKGQITVKIPTTLTAKTYTASISFAGDDNYAGSTGSVKVVVGKAKSKLVAKGKTFRKSVKTKKYAVTLKSDKNKAIKKVKVNIKIGKKTFKATTNAKGVATFKITKLTKTTKATVRFAGNTNFKAVSKKVTLTIK